MSIQSMTGFARTHGNEDRCAWTWEIKSVNGKGRDVRFRTPPGFDSLEPVAREKFSKRFRRGNFSAQLTVTWSKSASGYRVNNDVLDQVLALVPDLQARVPNATPPTLDGLLALKGVLEPVDEEMDEESRASLEAVFLSGLDQALMGLTDARAGEGQKMHDVMVGQLETIDALRVEAEALAAAQPEALRARMKEQIAAVLEDVEKISEDRLAQEVAIILTKADIREELDRLGAHVTAARDLLDAKDAVGRKFDFLCQEFNREANTLCSKSSDTELTRVGLALKVTIDQLREQVQNIE